MSWKLKGLKVHRDMSDETTAYTAQLVWRGRVVGEARNDGRGGSTFARGVCPSVEARAEALAIVLAGPLGEFCTPELALLPDDMGVLPDLADTLQMQEEEKREEARLAREEKKLVARNASRGMLTLRRPIDGGHQYVGVRHIAQLGEVTKTTGSLVTDWTAIECAV